MVSFLSVSRDPGQIVVFAGYIGLMIGMVMVLITRTADRRRRTSGSFAHDTRTLGVGGGDASEFTV